MYRSTFNENRMIFSYIKVQKTLTTTVLDESAKYIRQIYIVFTLLP